jgi:cysteinyl-tRNA synthetase
VDLKFPHHENEIAQSEGASGKKFCNCWLHNGFVNIGNEKMSKSKGNFMTLRGICKSDDDIRAYRYLVVSSQYRNPLSFTDEAIKASRSAIKRMDETLDTIQKAMASKNVSDRSSTNQSKLAQVANEALANFETALADDLSMPRAAAALFSVVKAAELEFKRVNQMKESGSSPEEDMDISGLKRIYEVIMSMDRVFGVFYSVPKTTSVGIEDKEKDSLPSSIPDEVLELVRSRSAAKDAKDWAQADLIRDRLTQLGYSVKDVKNGDPVISRI